MKRRGPLQDVVQPVLALAALAASPLRAQDAALPEEVELTVGADGTTIVREVRSAQLVAGDSSLHVYDVSPQLLPETLALRALATPELLELKEQTSWFEVLDPSTVLEHLSGRPVTFVRYHDSLVEKLEGTLLFPPRASGPDGDVKLPLYLQLANGRIRLLEDAELEIDALPPGDWNRFRLDWRLTCRRADRYRFELLYVTRGLQWRADYLLRVAADGVTADLTATATIENRTGVRWRSARVAVSELDGPLPWSLRADGERASPWIHPLADGVAVHDGATLQLPLAQAREFKVRQAASLVIDRASQPRDGEQLPVLRRFDVVDLAARGVARALPAGTARVVLLDRANRPYLAQPRPFSSSAAGEVLSFHADVLPGIVAARELPPTQPRFGDPFATTVRFTSERDEPLDVEVLCPLDVAESVGASSIPADRSRPRLARFVVPVPAHGAATLELRLARP